MKCWVAFIGFNQNFIRTREILDGDRGVWFYLIDCCKRQIRSKKEEVFQDLISTSKDTVT